MTFLSSSEFVSSGHPDRLADNLAAIVIDEIQKTDGDKAHAAIEVFITHDSVIFGGEATTTIPITDEYLKSVVDLGFRRSGYIPEIRKYWTKEECVLPEDMIIINKICPQSPDIALGTTDKGKDSGFNDQGVFFSSSENSNPECLGVPHLFAMRVSDRLKESSAHTILGDNSSIVLGPDNKVVVTLEVGDDGITPMKVKTVTIAVAHTKETKQEALVTLCKSIVYDVARELSLPCKDCEIIINGTGKFTVFGPVSDTSMTGRKISVNHPSAGPVWCNKMIGGGSLVKCFHASDLMLNLAARVVANSVVRSGLSRYAVVGISCAIGQVEPQSIFINGDSKFDKLSESKKKAIYDKVKNSIPWAPLKMAEFFGMNDVNFDFGEAVDKNFFGCNQPWEDITIDLK